MSFFRDKVVWITGASSGIGEALAYAFSEQGAKLVLSARREVELMRVRDNCTNPEHVLVMPMDVGALTDAAGYVKQVIGRFGTLDILVNNAGLSHWTKVNDLSTEVIKKIFDVNLFGGIVLTKGVLPVFLEKKNGVVVVVSSVLGKMTVRKQAAYNATKHALHGFYDTLRMEVGSDGVHILLVCPGFVSTEIARNSLNKDGVSINQDNEKIKRGLSPSFLASKILSAIRKRKQEIIVAGFPERFAIYMKRFVPGLYRTMMQKRKLL